MNQKSKENDHVQRVKCLKKNAIIFPTFRSLTIIIIIIIIIWLNN
jgi:hypothetical protein